MRCYREGLALAETLLTAGRSSPGITLITACRNLGQEAARRGDRETSLQYARRALEASDPSAAAANGRPAGVQLFLTPRGPAAMGLVYAGLARAGSGNADRQQAAQWLEKSLAAWKQAQSDPAFAPVHRAEMRQVEAALAGLRLER